MRKLQLTVILGTLAMLATSSAEASPRVGISLGFGVGPGFYRPYYGRPYYPYGYYYRPYPVVLQPGVIVASPPVIVQQPGVIYEQPATVIQSAPPVVQQQPVPIVQQQPQAQPQQTIPPPRLLETNAPPLQEVVAASSGNFDQCVQQLKSTSDKARREAAMDLGRMKAARAVDSLTVVLRTDASPEVRDAAARALGLIGSQRAMNPLIEAAQGDNDRDVRHSAQFSVEILRSNLRK